MYVGYGAGNYNYLKCSNRESRSNPNLVHSGFSPVSQRVKSFRFIKTTLRVQLISMRNKFRCPREILECRNPGSGSRTRSSLETSTRVIEKLQK